MKVGAALVYRMRDRIDMVRFAAAVREGLQSGALAERFGLAQSTARVLAKQVRDEAATR